MEALIALIAACVLALAHIFGARLRFLDVTPRSRWLSAAGGTSVAYVYLHLLPELQEGQSVFESSLEIIAYLEHHVYILALFGTVAFFGLDRIAKKSRQGNRTVGVEDATSHEVFWIHMVSFAVYNVIIGYVLLHREDPGYESLALYVVAIGLHFVVNDYGLRQDHKRAYAHVGRWVLAGAVIAGWALGVLVDISDVALQVVIAFLAGGIILNVLKEEIPEERESRFWAFALGAAFYGVLLLAV